MPGDATLGRRELLKSLGAAGAAVGLGAPAAAEPVPPSSPVHPHAAAGANRAEPLRWLTSNEAVTLEALVDTLIPKDEVGPGGVEAGLVRFIDGELAAGFGRGARMYLQG